jgi:nicotinamide mononucleotide adenylyltransferase
MVTQVADSFTVYGLNQYMHPYFANNNYLYGENHPMSVTHKQSPAFHRRIFWDVQVAKLDFEAKAQFVIERVFERGDVSDIRECRRYYSHETIETTLLSARYLSEPAMYLAAAVIKRNIHEFRCYKFRQSNPELSPY